MKLHWRVRQLLQAATVALPDDPELTEELLNTRYEVASDGRVKIELKDRIRARIGRSPDLTDAVVMLLGLQEESCTIGGNSEYPGF